MNTDYVDRLVENAVALSAAVHTHPRYDEFYKRLAPQINGRMGIYDYISEVAKALTKWEMAQLAGGEEPWEELDWIEVCESIADTMVDNGICTCDKLSPRTLVKQATRGKS